MAPRDEEMPLTGEMLHQKLRRAETLNEYFEATRETTTYDAWEGLSPQKTLNGFDFKAVTATVVSDVDAVS